MFRAVNSTKADVWRSRLRRFQASGLSVTRFCQVEQVSAAAFYQWRKRLGVSAAQETPPTFVPVRLTATAVVEIHLPNGARICVPAGQADSLRLVVETAGRLSGRPAGEADAC